MLDRTKLEQLSVLTLKNAVNSLINSQTILQLLVKKGIVTPEEINITRNIVSSQPKYKQLLDIINDLQDQVDEDIKFEKLVEKSLEPGGREKLTPEEKEYIMSKLER